MRPTPLLCHPVFVEKVWGGRALADLFGKPLPDPDAPFGESWEVADLPEGACGLDGPHATLAAARASMGGSLTGASRDGDRFPLLVKVLDARADLSVQVHPGEGDLPGLPDDARSKDECWVILDAQPGAHVLHGVTPEATPDALRAACEGAGDPVALMRRVDVSPGDVLRVPPGTLHAICAGVVLLEIQQPSDTTYRVWDYDRPGLDGKPRALHLDRALQVANFGDQPPEKLTPEPRPQGRVLVRAPSYRVEQVDLSAEGVTIAPDPESPRVVFAQSDGVTLEEGDAVLTLRRGQTAVVPAACGALTLSCAAPGAQAIVAAASDRDILGLTTP
jgi:mannose-6-phosphate isomerase